MGTTEQILFCKLFVSYVKCRAYTGTVIRGEKKREEFVKYLEEFKKEFLQGINGKQHPNLIRDCGKWKV